MLEQDSWYLESFYWLKCFGEMQYLHFLQEKCLEKEIFYVVKSKLEQIRFRVIHA